MKAPVYYSEIDSPPTFFVLSQQETAPTTAHTEGFSHTAMLWPHIHAELTKHTYGPGCGHNAKHENHVEYLH